MHILIWVLALVALGLWTLLAWASAWVLGLDPSWVGDLAPQVAQLPGAAWLDVWVPGWQPLVVATIEFARTLLGWLGGAGVVIVWVVWGLGSVLVVGAAALGSVAVGLVRRGLRPAAAAG
jgi:hypothetical protein